MEIDKCIKKDSKSYKKLKRMILLNLKNKDSYRIEDLKTEWQQGLEYYYKIEKIFKHKLQGSNIPMKMSLTNMHLWWKEFVLYSVSRLLQSYQYLMFFLWPSWQLHVLLQVFLEGGGGHAASPSNDIEVLKNC